MGQRAEIDQHPDLGDAQVRQHSDPLDRLLRPAHQDAPGKIGFEGEGELPGVPLLVALVGHGIGGSAGGFEPGGGIFAHRAMDRRFEHGVIVPGEEMGVVDAADFVVLDPPAGLPQGVPVPADALDRDIVVDMVGDVEKVVALPRRPFEALRRQQAGDPDRRVRLLVYRRKNRKAVHRGPEPAVEFERRLAPRLADQVDPFLDPLAALLHRHPEGVELVADEAATDAEIEASLRKLVESGRLFRHPNRVVQRQDRRPGTQPDPFGPRREEGEKRVVRRQQTAMADEVVLHHPCVIDADPVGVDDLLDHVVVMGMGVAGLGQVGRQEKQAEFHSRLSRGNDCGGWTI